MSASLVGSEMCIRDRYTFRSDGDFATVELLERALEYQWVYGYPRVPSGAVSYTHLTLPTICSV
eukprot:11855685-Alexandrium_andersonii.AAC.1